MNDQAPGHSPSRRWWSAFLVVWLLVLAAPGTLANAAPAAPPVPSFSLYLGSPTWPEYTPLDPTTLADLKGTPPLKYTGGTPQLLISAGGSTFVAIEHPDNAPDTVDIRDGLHGPERLHFTLDFVAVDSWLSPAGDLLAISTGLGSGVWLWQVFDTHTAELVAAIPCTSQEAAPDLIDPNGQRLYHPFYEASSAQSPPGGRNPIQAAIERGGQQAASERGQQATSTPPWQLWIAAYDMTTGKEIKRVAVPGVIGGNWSRGDAIQGAPVMDVEQPAVALSPDGAHLAVVDAAGTHLTLLDARTLTVAGSHTLHKPESAAHRLLQWLGIAPRTAEAKFMAGHQISAVFAPDGQHLYVTSFQTNVDATTHTMTGKGLGVRRIDVDTGEITAEALTGSVLDTLLPAPDGRSLYVSGSATP